MPGSSSSSQPASEKSPAWPRRRLAWSRCPRPDPVTSIVMAARRRGTESRCVPHSRWRDAQEPAHGDRRVAALPFETPPLAQIAVVDVLEKRLGSLPVIADFSRRLDIAGIIDRACPMRDIAVVSHGQVIEALIANRLTHPQAMVAVADWARDWAVEEVYAIPADALNDDRLGRALDAIAPQVEHIDAFGIDVTRLHWDMTSISLYGAYDQVDEDHPAPAYGHPKDRRTDLKQIQ